MNLEPQRRLAADILKVGVYRVWIDPLRIADVSDAITREDIRGLIRQGIIAVRPEQGTSRHRARERHIKRKKGARRGYGKRKGTHKSKINKKRAWINKVRPMRQLLRHLKNKNLLKMGAYRRLYVLIKGNMFRNKAHMKLYIKEHDLIQGE